MTDQNTDRSQRFLDEHEELGPGQRFRFRCHPGVSCFNACCSALTLMLTPYDVLRLRRETGLPSREFIAHFAEATPLPGCGLPMLRLRMLEGEKKPCPFVRKTGCSIYPNRPSACRTYPLGRATQPDEGGGVREQLFILREDHCKGFAEDGEWSAGDWAGDQGLVDYNRANDRFMEFVSRMQSSGRGLARQQTGLAFLALYQADDFGRFLAEVGALAKLDIPDERAEAVLADEEARLFFALDWLELMLLGRTDALRPKV